MTGDCWHIYREKHKKPIMGLKTYLIREKSIGLLVQGQGEMRNILKRSAMKTAETNFQKTPGTG
jgi:hypothetical protein